MYASSRGEKELTVIDAGSLRVVGTISLLDGSHGIDFGADGTRAYVTNEKAGTEATRYR